MLPTFGQAVMPIRFTVTLPAAPAAQEVASLPTTITGLSIFGTSILFGTGGADRIETGDTRDLVFGLDGADTIAGGAGADRLFGNAGDDTLAGGIGTDGLFGGSGADVLDGGRGNDRLVGGSGDDDLTGGIGNDVLLGGTGADTFVFDPSRAGEGRDTIVDFELGTDRIGLAVDDVLAATPGLLGPDGAFQASDLDASPRWDIVEGDAGAATIVHPNGTITLATVPFSEDLTFEAVFDTVVELI